MPCFYITLYCVSGLSFDAIRPLSGFCVRAFGSADTSVDIDHSSEYMRIFNSIEIDMGVNKRKVAS